MADQMVYLEELDALDEEDAIPDENRSYYEIQECEIANTPQARGGATLTHV